MANRPAGHEALGCVSPNANHDSTKTRSWPFFRVFVFSCFRDSYFGLPALVAHFSCLLGVSCLCETIAPLRRSLHSGGITMGKMREVWADPTFIDLLKQGQESADTPAPGSMRMRKDGTSGPIRPLSICSNRDRRVRI